MREGGCGWSTECLRVEGRASLPDAHFRKAAAEGAFNRQNRRTQIAGHFGLCFTTQRQKAFSGTFPMTAKLQTCTCWLTYRRNWQGFFLPDGQEAAWWLMHRKIALPSSA